MPVYVQRNENREYLTDVFYAAGSNPEYEVDTMWNDGGEFGFKVYSAESASSFLYQERGK